jgi:hypothetical protein
VAQGPDLAKASATLSVHVAPPPGTARIRFVVRDSGNGHLGTADAKP